MMRFEGIEVVLAKFEELESAGSDFGRFEMQWKAS
jgi:hypothetical protein